MSAENAPEIAESSSQDGLNSNVVEATLMRTARSFQNDPEGFVWWCYDWEKMAEAEGLDVSEVGPDDWQIDVLHTLGEELKKRDPAEPEYREVITGAIRLAVASGHGIGKTALICWLIHWFISTHPNPQITVTAGTKTQLTGKTWRELAKWQRWAINGHWFNWTATQYKFIAEPQTWYAQAIPWSKSNPDAFAGTHEKYVLIIYDEGSAIEDIIWEVSEGAMTTSGALWIVFGNPTQNIGRFRECFRRYRHRWLRWMIDSRSAKMADKRQIQEWIDDYGEDSDFARVRIKGQFPRVASTQFISSEDVERCAANDAEGYATQPIIIGVDVARYGDDKSAITVRQGQRQLELRRYTELSTDKLALKVLEIHDQYRSDAIMVDAVGVGSGVVDTLRMLRPGLIVIEVHAGAGADDPIAYFNKRTEMYARCRQWLRREGTQIIDDAELKDELTSLQYGFTGKKEQIQLWKKEEMKKELGYSPDSADSLALTFAYDFIPEGHESAIRAGERQEQSRTGIHPQARGPVSPTRKHFGG